MDINAEALIQLRRVVAEHADHLDMRSFSDGCGTVRCAAGWFAGDAWARANTVIAEAFDADGKTRSFLEPPRVLQRIFGKDVDILHLFFAGIWDTRPIDAAEVIAQIDLILAGKPTDGYPCDAPEAPCS